MEVDFTYEGYGPRAMPALYRKHLPEIRDGKSISVPADLSSRDVLLIVWLRTVGGSVVEGDCLAEIVSVGRRSRSGRVLKKGRTAASKVGEITTTASGTLEHALEDGSVVEPGESVGTVIPVGATRTREPDHIEGHGGASDAEAESWLIEDLLGETSQTD